MKPNILFFLPDQHRPDWMGVNSGLRLRTSNLDRLCASGVHFVNAFTPSPTGGSQRASTTRASSTAAAPIVRRGSRRALTATFLDYTAAPGLPSMESRSLRGVLEGRTETHRDCVVSGLNGWRMVFDGRHKLVTRMEAAPLLYDIEADPQELKDIAATQPGVVARLTRMAPR